MSGVIREWVLAPSTRISRELKQPRRRPQRRLQKNYALTLYEGRGHTTTNFPSSFWAWIKSLRIQFQEKSPAFDILSGSKWTRLSLKERKFIFLPSFSLLSSSFLLMVPRLCLTTEIFSSVWPTVGCFVFKQNRTRVDGIFVIYADKEEQKPLYRLLRCCSSSEWQGFATMLN